MHISTPALPNHILKCLHPTLGQEAVISLGTLVEAVVQDTVADHLLALDRKVVQGDNQVEDTDIQTIMLSYS